MVSPGPAMTRLTRRVPSEGEKRITTSPLAGPCHWVTHRLVKGTRRPKASLFTKRRSPGRMVGSIEPVGTSFQSAIAERKGATIAATIVRGSTHSLANLRQRVSGLAGAAKLADGTAPGCMDAFGAAA